MDYTEKVILLIRYEDPLTLAEVEVNDVSAAYYVLRVTNDLSFALGTMAATMEKEYSRNVEENFQLQHDLVAPYLETDTSVTSEGFEIKVPLREIPKPLPSVVPKKIRDAVEYLDAQLVLHRQRMEADLVNEQAPLRESLQTLEGKVKAWFKSEIENGADWLNGSNKVVLSGGTLRYINGDVTFSYQEMNYD